MAQDPNKPQGGSAAPGQQQMHSIYRVNPATGQQETQQVTQEQWKNGNYQAEGWQRGDAPAPDQTPPQS
jgi:hypothetical protein